jgi:hypothetical protein
VYDMYSCQIQFSFLSDFPLLEMEIDNGATG